jgi:hypothetical protein
MVTKSYPDLLAHGVATADIPGDFELFAGNIATRTNQGTATNAAIPQFTVLGMVAASQLIKAWDPTASDGSERPIGVAAQPIAANGKGPYYEDGVFNHEALKWPAAIDTIAKRKNALAGRPFSVRHLP